MAWTATGIAWAFAVLVPVVATAAPAAPAEAPVPERRPSAPLAVPPPPADVPDGSFGCVVVGLLVDDAGKAVRPRPMQQAFSNAVPGSIRDAFAAAAATEAARWRFEPATARHLLDHWVMRSVGFLPGPDGRPVVVEGIEHQSPRLAGHCMIADLAAWGEVNAISVEAATAANGGKVVASTSDNLLQTWIRRSMPPPKYPKDAVRSGLSGCVVLGLTIGEDGVPREFRVMSSQASSPEKGARALFETAALKASTAWRFSPGPDNLGRVAALVQVPAEFRMDGVHVGRKCQAVDVMGPATAGG